MGIAGGGREVWVERPILARVVRDGAWGLNEELSRERSVK